MRLYAQRGPVRGHMCRLVSPTEQSQEDVIIIRKCTRSPEEKIENSNLRVPLESLRKSRTSRTRLLCIAQSRGFFFAVLNYCLAKYHSMPLKSHIPLLRVLFFGCATVGGRIFHGSQRHHSSSTSFSHTLTSATHQRQCRGSSLSPQHLSFASGKLTLK